MTYNVRNLVNDITSSAFKDLSFNERLTLYRNLSVLAGQRIVLDLINFKDNLFSMFLKPIQRFNAGYRFTTMNLASVETYLPDIRIYNTSQYLNVNEQLSGEPLTFQIRVSVNQTLSEQYFSDLESFNLFFNLQQKRISDTQKGFLEQLLNYFFGADDYLDTFAGNDTLTKTKGVLDTYKNQIQVHKNNNKTKKLDDQLDQLKYLKNLVSRLTRSISSDWNYKGDYKRTFSKENLILLCSDTWYNNIAYRFANLYNTKDLGLDLTVFPLSLPDNVLYLIEKDTIWISPKLLRVEKMGPFVNLDYDFISYFWYYFGINNAGVLRKIEFKNTRTNEAVVT